ncbi:SRPBCC family protein [Luteimonas sp. RD2P54]|uniref:SRPBCC family protein n=1 Tax=Luteimonas endophytica TaxID=3042023 RepID=A0ABT6JB91_9GAMM|nr:SRPBCC family protein [Luteimonas endophytica]MDH5824095.1 SRPBCC family protein [Luteimonas endophytica]
MTRLLELLISLVIVAVLFVVVGVLLPSERNLVEQVETNRRQTIVFDTINSFRRFDDWHPMVLQDPAIELNRSGPDEGVGARLDFSSDNRNIGDGSWEIVASEPRERVEIAITDEHRGSDKRTVFTLRPTGRGGRNMEITQTYHVEYGWDLIGRYAGLYVSRNVGDNMQLGLRRLSNMLASVPNVDYATEGTTLRGMTTEERPAEDLLVVKAGAIERNNQKIQDSMEANMEWINRTMAANDLEAAGPMRIVSTELGRETYTFDVVQPVRRQRDGDDGNGEDQAETQDDEAADEDAAQSEDGEAEGERVLDNTPVPVVAAEGEELQDLELLGPVEYVRSEPSLVAKGRYTGYMAELENVRNALRAWAMTQGHEAVGRPYEIYIDGIDAAFTQDGEYEVFWNLKQ